jgi:hypothetical protein
LDESIGGVELRFERFKLLKVKVIAIENFGVAFFRAVQLLLESCDGTTAMSM